MVALVEQILMAIRINILGKKTVTLKEMKEEQYNIENHMHSLPF